MVSSGVHLLLHRYGVLPGRRAVVLTADNAGYATAWSLKDAGAEVTVVDLRSEGGWPEGFSVLAGSTIVSAHGRRRVSAVSVGPPGATSGQKVSCDLVVIACVQAPSTNLLAQAGARLDFDEVTQAFLPAEMPEGTHAIGAVIGARSTAAAEAQGTLAGLEAAAALGYAIDGTAADALRAEASAAGDPVVLPPEASSAGGKQFACLCMDVTARDLETAVAEGFDSMELLRRYTGTTTGPCQGKACMLATLRLCGRATGRSLTETGLTTARPPWTPVEMGRLAGARLTPRKETAMHDRHVAAGAELRWDGDWRRPHHYTAPDEEAHAVHHGVGLIDVSSLGKFRIKGAQAVDLLELLYPCRFSDLPVGRVRYAAMLNAEGVILDDGTIARLGDDEFFVTTTTGNADAVERWITWWNTDRQLDALVVNVTGAFGAVNLAGPRARGVIGSLTDTDVSPATMPSMSATRTGVAGVPSLVLRLGFVGETGYEIHFPSAYGEHLWDAVMEAGRAEGIAPFGLEAQRILRLEKQHILVGQDTDARSDPYGAGLGWMVDDKAAFLGLGALRDRRDRAPGERLVGFTAPDGWVPPEGASVVRDDVRVGRVTSSRRSAAVGAVVGLAWVPAGWATEGQTFEIRYGASHTTGTVRTTPSYEPRERLRS
jgi:sarcosine oxidase subunit alpha